jgi:hypothetical protein
MLEIILLVLGVGTLAFAARRPKKGVIAALGLIWVGGIGPYVYISCGPQRAMRAAERRTTKAVIEVGGLVGEDWDVVQAVELTASDEIASLFDGLKLKRNASFLISSCKCLGNPRIQLHDTTGQFATITLHHGKSVRGTLWLRGNVGIRRSALAELEAFMGSRGVALVP